MEDNLSYSSFSLVNNDMTLMSFCLKLQGADNGSDSVNPAESWNFFRKRGGKSSKGKKEKHNKENSKVLEIPISKYWNMTLSIWQLFVGSCLMRQNITQTVKKVRCIYWILTFKMWTTPNRIRSPSFKTNRIHWKCVERTVKKLVGYELTIRPAACKGYGSIAHEVKPNGLLTRGPWERRV